MKIREVDYGMVIYLENIGVFGENFLVVYFVWVSLSEVFIKFIFFNIEEFYKVEVLNFIIMCLIN